jgi:hypothetical protein
MVIISIVIFILFLCWIPLFFFCCTSLLREIRNYDQSESCEILILEETSEDRIKETAEFISEVSWQDNEGKWHSIDDPRQSIERIKELADAYLALIKDS